MDEISMIYNKVSLRVVWLANEFNLGLSMIKGVPVIFDLFSVNFFKIKMSDFLM